MNEIETLLTAIKGLVDVADDELTDEVLNAIKTNLDQNFSPTLISQSVNQIIKNLEDQGVNKVEAREAVKALEQTLAELIYGEEQYSGNKKILIDDIVARLNGVFEAAVEKFHSFSIELPMTIDKGAQVPTYAHDTDAAADLYAMEDVTIEARSYGNKIRTGVKIQLPEGWMALIIPRSSIGAKTPLRLSNSIGLIDSGYRGELGILYDNTSDTPYDIKAGDRIAQLLVMPSDRFQAKVVDILASSDRGEGGFGSSGQ